MPNNVKRDTCMRLHRRIARDKCCIHTWCASVHFSKSYCFNQFIFRIRMRERGREKKNKDNDEKTTAKTVYKYALHARFSVLHTFARWECIHNCNFNVHLRFLFVHFFARAFTFYFIILPRWQKTLRHISLQSAKTDATSIHTHEAVLSVHTVFLALICRFHLFYHLRPLQFFFFYFSFLLANEEKKQQKQFKPHVDV